MFVFITLDSVNKWTYEKCQEVSKLCKNKTDFLEKYNFAYRRCLKKKWINDFFYKNKV